MTTTTTITTNNCSSNCGNSSSSNSSSSSNNNNDKNNPINKTDSESQKQVKIFHHSVKLDVGGNEHDDSLKLLKKWEKNSGQRPFSLAMLLPKAKLTKQDNAEN